MQRSKSTPNHALGRGTSGTGLGGPPQLKKKPKPPNYPIRNQVFYRFGDENYTVGVVTMQGKREDMEDAHDVRLQLKDKPRQGMFGVYDGHSGSLAANWTTENLHRFIEVLEDLNQETISKALIEADQAFLTCGIDVMNGTTAVFAITEIFDEGNKQGDATWKTVVGNLGDSRCIIGNYSDAQFHCMTTDHKPTDEGEMERVNAAGGFIALKRVDGILAVSRSIGDGTYKNIPDLPPEKQKVIPIPDVTERLLTEDNFIFICCDGIFETFTNEEALAFIYESSKTKTDICEILSDLLYAVLNKGSKDNMSAMIIRKKNGAELAKPSFEFIAGEFYPNGTDVYMEAYNDNCKRYGVSVEDAKRMWEERKAAQDLARVQGLTLASLREKYMKTECIASESLKHVFFGVNGSAKVKPGQSFTKKTGKK